VMTGAGSTVLESGADGEVGDCGLPSVLSARALVNSGYITLTGEIDGKEGASIDNQGTFDITPGSLSVAGFSAEVELSVPLFVNDGAVETNGNPVVSDWEVEDDGTLPGPIECAVCDILYPETDPPSGICSVATSDDIAFYPRPGAPFPPGLKSSDGWFCEEDG
jgi:hypothetical protein